MTSYDDFLIGMQQGTAQNHSRKEHFEESFGYREIDGKTGPVSPTYLPLQNELLSRYFYEAYCTFDIHHDDCYKQRLWYETLQLNFSIGVYVHQRKNFLGNLTYVWRICENNERSHEDLIETLNFIKKTIPKYSSRDMDKEFFDSTTNLALNLEFSKTSTTSTLMIKLLVPAKRKKRLINILPTLFLNQMILIYIGA